MTITPDPAIVSVPDAAEEALLRDRAGAVRLPRDFVRVQGADATSYLEGQLSQDIGALAAGASAASFVLQPQGKVDAWVRVTRLDDHDFLLDADAGTGDALVARLERFRLRVEVEVAACDWECVAVRGPGSSGIDVVVSGAAVVDRSPWGGDDGFDLLGDSIAVPDGLTLVAPAALELLRIEAGIPRHGMELDGATIPAEAGVVDRSVSFTKGCFVGQELVARIDSRGGNVARRLRGVLIGDGLRAATAPAPGAVLTHDGADVGHLTSVAWSHRRNAAVALAYVRRGVEIPAEVTVGDGLRATLGELPFPVA